VGKKNCSFAVQRCDPLDENNVPAGTYRSEFPEEEIALYRPKVSGNIAHGQLAKHAVRTELGRRKNLVQQKNNRIHLTPTGLLMEGDCTSVRFLLAFFRANERYGDITTVIRVRNVSLLSQVRLCERRLMAMFQKSSNGQPTAGITIGGTTR
jgi:hypothetical protein